MNNIKKIRTELTYTKRIAEFTESLRVLAASNRIKYTHMLENCNKIQQNISSCSDIHNRNVLHEADIDNQYIQMFQQRSGKQAHIILGCDQKFCKNFIKNILSYANSINFKKCDMCFILGKQLFHLSKNMHLSTDQIQCMPMIQSLDEAEYIICELYGYNIHIHSYTEEQYTEKVLTFSHIEKIYDDIDTVSRSLYAYCLENQLYENTQRSASMFEASENSKEKSKQLNNKYNKIRQSEITQVIISQL